MHLCSISICTFNILYGNDGISAYTTSERLKGAKHKTIRSQNRKLGETYTVIGLILVDDNK